MFHFNLYLFFADKKTYPNRENVRWKIRNNHTLITWFKWSVNEIQFKFRQIELPNSSKVYLKKHFDIHSHY